MSNHSRSFFLSLVFVLCMPVLHGQTKIPFTESFTPNNNFKPPYGWSTLNGSKIVLDSTSGKYAVLVSTSRAGEKSVFYANKFACSANVVYSIAVSFKTTSSNFKEIAVVINSTSLSKKFTTTSAPKFGSLFTTISGTFQALANSNFQLSLYAIPSAQKTSSKIVFSALSVSMPCTTTENKPAVVITSDSPIICANTNQVLHAKGAHTYSWYNGSSTSTIIPSLTPGIPISVVGTNTITGCSNNATISLNFKPIPPLNYILSSPSVCLGSTVNIELRGASSYSWCDGPLSPTRNCTITESQQTYTVTGIGKYGCNSNSVITIIGIPPPSISILLAKKLECSLDSIVLCTPKNLQMTWLYKSSKNTGNQVTLPASIRHLTLSAVNDFGCTSSAEITVPNIECPPLQSKEGTAIFFSNTKNGFSFNGITGPIRLFQNTKLNSVNCNLVDNSIDTTNLPLADGTYSITDNELALNWLLIKKNNSYSNKE